MRQAARVVPLPYALSLAQMSDDEWPFLRYGKQNSAETRAEGGSSMTPTRRLKRALVELDALKWDILITLAAMLLLLLALSLLSFLG